MTSVVTTDSVSCKSKEGKETRFDLYAFSFEEWDDYKRNLWKSWFKIDAVEEAVHKILWSEKVMWEFFRDKSGLVYSTEAFEEFVRKLWLVYPLEEFDSSDIYFNLWKSWVLNFGKYILPPSIETCIEWSKCAQLILSTRQGTKEIVWELFSYITDFDTAFDREFIAHYSHAREEIKESIIRQNWYLPDEFLVFSSIWIKNGYSDEVSMRSMFRLMREWAWIIKDNGLVNTLWIAEMNKGTHLNNWFFKACKKRLWVSELTLLDWLGNIIGPKNNTNTYNSTMTIFNTHATIDLVAGWISSVIRWT